ncbi:MAG: thiamine-phosphate kinase [Syntrophobacterales bacterium]|nr:thiamine-phosphate kinase [Syntrophobacterales bacterium]
METKKDITLADKGEFGFIEMLRSRFGDRYGSDVVVGIGDDVAVIDLGGPEYLLATCDAQIGNVHFPLELIPPYDLGLRVVEVNASDIAAMGGRPKWALVGLNLPSRTPLKFLEDFYSGIGDALIRMGASLVGGNCSRTREEIVIDLFLMGTVSKGQLIKRRGASPGDIIFVTGTLGKARAGLELVIGDQAKAKRCDEIVFKRAQESFFRPLSRVFEGSILAGSGCVTAMIDISDGFIQDLGHLARENRLDAIIELFNIPIDPVCVEVAGLMGYDSLYWALSGGEDYELLFTVPEELVDDLLRYYQGKQASSVGITSVGRFVEGSGKVFILDDKGRIFPASDFIPRGGWDHFRN